MTVSTSRVALSVAAALAAGLVLRLWLVHAFPFEGGDTRLYEALARNLQIHGAFALELDGRLTPVDVRMPGYPALLAACHVLFGPGFTPVRVVQALVDTLTCLGAGALAVLLAAPAGRPRAWVAGTWLAALCPFTANYAAAILTETPATFFTALAFALVFLATRRAEEKGRLDSLALAAFAAAGLTAGLGCYLRPETPILLAAPGLVLAFRWRRPRDLRRLVMTGLALGLGLALALAPWAVRNAVACGRFEVLPPVAANLPGETTAAGFNAWTDTWLTTVPQIYAFQFRIEEQPLEVDALPSSAYDSREERAEVARLFAEHNENLTLTPELDRAFARLARERTAHHPLRTWVAVPLRRVLTMWLAPRTELLPLPGQLAPIDQSFQDDPIGSAIAIFLVLVNLLYLALGAIGAVRAPWRTGVVMLVVYFLLRTVLVTRLPTPEPRYMVVCFPLLAALAAQVWADVGPPLPAAGSGRSTPRPGFTGENGSRTRSAFRAATGG
jgi:hypothetical protein